jgi:biotin/methionine sulfoxide reductase
LIIQTFLIGPPTVKNLMSIRISEVTKSKSQLTASHWGVGVAHVKNGVLERVEGHQDDNDASLINQNIASSLNGEARVLRPTVRRGWLENGPQGNTGKRGQDSFVEVSWDKALDLVATEVARVRAEYGNGAIFAGSYGWSSAGRFHHAQSQLKRFLNSQGGFVRSEGNYSFNAALGLMPHIVGSFRTHVAQATRWTVIAEHTDLVVMFGGLAVRNTQVSDGGVARHRIRDNLVSCAKSGVKFINISPLRSDAMAELDAEWLPPLPGSDTAIMLGVAHTLLSNGLHDVEFLRTYTTGFDKFSAYLTGSADGVVKDAGWAAEISKIPADRIEELARQMASGRTMISLGAGVQRTDYG